jgi:hypothetical protein
MTAEESFDLLQRNARTVKQKFHVGPPFLLQSVPVQNQSPQLTVRRPALAAASPTGSRLMEPPPRFLMSLPWACTTPILPRHSCPPQWQDPKPRGGG